jgi:hypothetical protein
VRCVQSLVSHIRLPYVLKRRSKIDDAREKREAASFPREKMTCNNFSLIYMPASSAVDSHVVAVYEGEATEEA